MKKTGIQMYEKNGYICMIKTCIKIYKKTGIHLYEKNMHTNV